MNGAIPEPFIRTAEALLSLLGKEDVQNDPWKRPKLTTARASHAWKWLRRQLFGNCVQFENEIRNLNPDNFLASGQKIARARAALECDSFVTDG